MKYYLFFLFLGIFLLSAKCSHDEDCHNIVKIINNTNNPIYFYVGLNYPDTSIVNANPSKAGSYYKIGNNSTGKYITSSCFEYDLRLNPCGKVMYFIFDANTLENTPWDTIINKYMILKRYDLTLDDLQKMNWTITYP